MPRHLPVITTLQKFIKKPDRTGNFVNRRITYFDTYGANITEMEFKFILEHFPSIRSFRIPTNLLSKIHKLLLTNSDGSENPINERIDYLDIGKYLNDHDSKWIAEHFPNAKIITPVTRLKKGDVSYDALPEAFIELGPHNIHQIRDPAGLVPPFTMSHFTKEKMNRTDAIQFCINKGRLPSVDELEALQRALTPSGEYNCNIIPEIKYHTIWSLSDRRDAMTYKGHYYFFDGKSGSVGFLSDYDHSVLCVR